jgi:hypothetical protein
MSSAPWAASVDSRAAGGGDAEDQKVEIVAYYFHGNMRCKTCRAIEAYSEEAIKTGFAEELESGRLIWRAVNTDEAENKHFIEDFELATKSVVLAEYRNGELGRWQNLNQVWQLVRDKARFVDYVRNETRKFIGEG